MKGLCGSSSSGCGAPYGLPPACKVSPASSSSTGRMNRKAARARLRAQRLPAQGAKGRAGCGMRAAHVMLQGNLRHSDPGAFTLSLHVLLHTTLRRHCTHHIGRSQPWSPSASPSVELLLSFLLFCLVPKHNAAQPLSTVNLVMDMALSPARGTRFTVVGDVVGFVYSSSRPLGNERWKSMRRGGTVLHGQ